MTRNQLPEGVGKKIVEALKRQAEADITTLSEPEDTLGNNIPLNDIQDLPDISLDDDIVVNEMPAENTIVEEEPISVLPLGAIKQKEAAIAPEPIAQEEKPIIEPVKTAAEIPLSTQDVAMNISSQNFQNVVQPQNVQMNAQAPMFQTEAPRTIQQEVLQKAVNAEVKSRISIPANVAVLKNLIASLPVGVTKQTGAQIIRQTLEAMGIPMNGVLKEAQEVQEELNSSTRECMLRIQEYKTNILQLEQTVQEYQKNITQINDLVSLFLLTDRK